MDKTLIIDNYIKRNIVLVNCCCMCKESGEFVDHLLLHYLVAHDL